MNLKELAQVAIKAAKTAGKVIQLAAEQDIEVDHKDGGNTYASQVVTAIDRKCDGIIREILEPSCTAYDIGILSEEYPDDGSRFEKDFFWCVDPLDGTLAFINKIPGFSVSIALVSREGRPLIGVVYNPMTEVLYHAIDKEGVYRNELPWEPVRLKNKMLTYVSDKSLEKTPNPEVIQSILTQKTKALQLNGIKTIYGGGAVWNAICVLEETPGIMLKQPKYEKGGGSLWDYAATACIFAEAGYQATSFTGEALELNKVTDSFMNHQGVYYFSS